MNFFDISFSIVTLLKRLQELTTKTSKSAQKKHLFIQISKILNCWAWVDIPRNSELVEKKEHLSNTCWLLCVIKFY